MAVHNRAVMPDTVARRRGVVTVHGPAMRRRVVPVRGSTMRMRPGVVPMRRPMMGMRGAMTADIDPAVPRSPGGHRRERWRQLWSGLLLGWRSRRGRFGGGLLWRRRRLVRRRLLRR